MYGRPSEAEAPSQPVPPGENAGKVRVALRPPIRMMDAAHVGRDDDPSEPTVPRFGQCHVAVVEGDHW